MPKMMAAEAAVRVLEREGVTVTFGVPGAAINPFYAAMRAHGGIRDVLARHVEGASHMAEGYTRARAGNIGVCIGTSGPAGTDMITGLYAASADSIPTVEDAEDHVSMGAFAARKFAAVVANARRGSGEPSITTRPPVSRVPSMPGQASGKLCPAGRLTR